MDAHASSVKAGAARIGVSPQGRNEKGPCVPDGAVVSEPNGLLTAVTVIGWPGASKEDPRPVADGVRAWTLALTMRTGLLASGAW
jgi:hypothetical protein